MICPVVMYAPMAATNPSMASWPLVLSACSIRKFSSFSFMISIGGSFAKMFCLPYSVITVIELKDR
mgnify:CR=1 FL=1